MATNTAWWEARITKLQELVEAYEAAILVVSTTGQSYTLDTGQSKQTVNRGNLMTLQSQVDSWLNEIAVLEQRLYGRAKIVRPLF